MPTQEQLQFRNLETALRASNTGGPWTVMMNTDKASWYHRILSGCALALGDDDIRYASGEIDQAGPLTFDAVVVTATKIISLRARAQGSGEAGMEVHVLPREMLTSVLLDDAPEVFGDEPEGALAVRLSFPGDRWVALPIAHRPAASNLESLKTLTQELIGQLTDR